MKNWLASPDIPRSIMYHGIVRRAVRRWGAGAPLVICALLFFFAGRMAARAEDSQETVGVSTIDGREMRGEWLSADERGVLLRLEGLEQRVAWDDLLVVRFESAAEPPRGAAMMHLSDGGMLPGDLAGAAPDAVVVRTRLGDQTPLPFSQLSGVQLAARGDYARSTELFEAALADRLPGQDVLVTRSTDDAKSLRGRLVSLDPERGTFEFGGRERSFQLDKIFGIVFAAGAAAPSAEPMTIRLADGSAFSGRLRLADAESLLWVPSFGGEYRLPRSLVTEILIRSRRVVYVSDLTTLSERVEGRVHRTWPVMRDRNVSGGPLAIGNVKYGKGLGVHSRTELVYELNGRYEAFVADVGIDNHVRPRGSVVFRVMGDERVLFESELVTGADAAVPVRVDVKGVERMTLVVDYGDELDYGDQADWAGARLLLPVPPGSDGGQTQ